MHTEEEMGDAGAERGPARGPRGRSGAWDCARGKGNAYGRSTWLSPREVGRSRLRWALGEESPPRASPVASACGSHSKWDSAFAPCHPTERCTKDAPGRSFLHRRLRNGDYRSKIVKFVKRIHPLVASLPSRWCWFDASATQYYLAQAGTLAPFAIAAHNIEATHLTLRCAMTCPLAAR